MQYTRSKNKIKNHLLVGNNSTVLELIVIAIARLNTLQRATSFIQLTGLFKK